jgi:methylated-DNA-protein-cysteine methyltransferase-like protein
MSSSFETLTPFTRRVITIISQIPSGKVLTYGLIAKIAGSPRAARQVSWILHSSSEKYDLPWHRVVNAQGKIVLVDEEGQNEQKNRLLKEGIQFIKPSVVDLQHHLWLTADFHFSD